MPCAWRGVGAVASAVGVTALLVVAPAGAAEPPPPLTEAPLYATMLDRWSPTAFAYRGLPGPPRTRLNSLMLRLHVRAVLDGPSVVPASYADRRRIAELVDTLTQPPAFRDGPYSRYDRNDPDQSHRPGFTQAAGRGGSSRNAAQHIAIDPEAAIALAEAYDAGTKVDLPARLRTRIRRVVLRVARHRMFAPDQVRIGQLLWTAEMLWAKRLVDGDLRAFVRGYRRALDTQRRLLPRLLTRDAGYRYVPNDRANRINLMDTPEYSLIALAGAQYLPQALKAGMRLRAGERTIYRRWMRRVVWGSFGDDGTLNWDTGWGADRRYLTQYWGWATVELQAIGTMPGGFLPAADRRRVAALCGRVRARYQELADRRGVLPKTLYNASTRFRASGSDQALGSLRLLRSIADCGDAPAPTAAASFDRDQPRYAVTTSRYSTSVVSWSRDLTSGVLPTRLVDAGGRAIGGLGGRRSSFDLQAGGLRLAGGAVAGTRVRLSARPGSGPLASRRSLRGTITRGGQQANVRFRFEEAGWTLSGRLRRPAARRWRIPIGGSARVTVHRGRTTVLRIRPTEGSSWQVLIPERGRVSLAPVSRDPLDPTVRRVAVIALPRGRALGLRVRVA